MHDLSGRKESDSASQGKEAIQEGGINYVKCHDKSSQLKTIENLIAGPRNKLGTDEFYKSCFCEVVERMAN